MNSNCRSKKCNMWTNLTPMKRILSLNSQSSRLSLRCPALLIYKSLSTFIVNASQIFILLEMSVRIPEKSWLRLKSLEKFDPNIWHLRVRVLFLMKTLIASHLVNTSMKGSKAIINWWKWREVCQRRRYKTLLNSM